MTCHWKSVFTTRLPILWSLSGRSTAFTLINLSNLSQSIKVTTFLGPKTSFNLTFWYWRLENVISIFSMIDMVLHTNLGTQMQWILFVWDAILLNFLTKKDTRYQKNQQVLLKAKVWIQWPTVCFIWTHEEHASSEGEEVHPQIAPPTHSQRGSYEKVFEIYTFLTVFGLLLCWQEIQNQN